MNYELLLGFVDSACRKNYCCGYG